jgi:hypothetical protein
MPRTWLTEAAVGRTIDAPADNLYRLITDLTAAGDRSEECTRAEWLDKASREAVVGARFRGHNRSRLARWSRVCEVIEADPARAPWSATPTRSPGRRLALSKLSTGSCFLTTVTCGLPCSTHSRHWRGKPKLPLTAILPTARRSASEPIVHHAEPREAEPPRAR